MTPKELQYIEDALGHEKQMELTCRNLADSIQDPELKKYVMGLANKHKKQFDRFYALTNV